MNRARTHAKLTLAVVFSPMVSNGVNEQMFVRSPQTFTPTGESRAVRTEPLFQPDLAAKSKSVSDLVDEPSHHFPP